MSPDVQGLRTSWQDASGVTDFLWDGQRLLAELSGGSTVAQYTSGLDAYGPMLSQCRSGASRFYHPSVLGTIETLTDASGSVTDSYVLTAFGVQVASSGSTTNPHRYIGALGYYTDPATGLDYVRARYLRPSTGSWLSVDPVEGEPRYECAGNSPALEVDPSGLQPRWPRWLRPRLPWWAYLGPGGVVVYVAGAYIRSYVQTERALNRWDRLGDMCEVCRGLVQDDTELPPEMQRQVTTGACGTFVCRYNENEQGQTGGWTVIVDGEPRSCHTTGAAAGARQGPGCGPTATPVSSVSAALRQ